ncbi:MAG TPA: hypothetical protein VG602_01485 [Actinomycetota bacterium]|nr:hypothetical protein [Actinomycetota bacterium]
MGIKNENAAVFPKNWAEVYQAAVNVIPTIPKMKVKSADQSTGRIIAGKGMSMRSWGEEVIVDVWEVSPKKAGVRVTSALKAQLVDWGANKKNVAAVLDAISAELKTPAQPLPDSG